MSAIFRQLDQATLSSFMTRVHSKKDWDSRQGKPRIRPGTAMDISCTVQSMFEARVEMSPHHPAVSPLFRDISYRKLNIRANRLAHYLRRKGVGPGNFVALFMEQELGTVIAMLAILKAGGAILPLDPVAFADRWSRAIQEAGCRLWVINEARARHLVGDRPKLVITDGKDREAIASESDRNPAIIKGNDELSYCPDPHGDKHGAGVLSEWEFIRQIITMNKATERDRCLPFPTLDTGLMGQRYLGYLLAGATLILPRLCISDEPSTLLWACVVQGVTLLQLPTAYWHILVDELETLDFSWPRFLGTVVLEGEPPLRNRLDIWHERVPTSIQLVHTR